MVKNNKGSTLVEVMVSFTILMIIFAMFYHIIKLSDNMYMDSVDMIKNQEKLNERVYMNAEDAVAVDTDLFLELDTSKTQKENGAVATKLDLTKGSLKYIPDAELQIKVYKVFLK